jgi:periplasmic copper chaperone A
MGGMSIDISRPWIRTSQGEKRQTGGFFTVTNKSGEADRLIAAESPVATKIEIHGIKVVGAGIRMKLLEQGLRLPPDTAITLKPRGYHLLIELKAPLAQGQRVPMTLTFEKAGPQTVELLVEAPGPVGEETLVEGQPG